MTVTLPDKESDAIIKLAVELDLTATQVVIQAIRQYQMVMLGHAKLVRSDPPVGCPALDFHS